MRAIAPYYSYSNIIGWYVKWCCNHACTDKENSYNLVYDFVPSIIPLVFRAYVHACASKHDCIISFPDDGICMDHPKCLTYIVIVMAINI